MPAQSLNLSWVWLLCSTVCKLLRLCAWHKPRVTVNIGVMLLNSKRKILWVDCVGGLAVGVIVLLGCRLISRLDSLPLWVIIGFGIANLVYGAYSLWLTTRKPRPLILLKVLALANMAWLAVCVAIVATHWQEISLFGVCHKLGEGIYVAGLGMVEWKWRHQLSG